LFKKLIGVVFCFLRYLFSFQRPNLHAVLFARAFIFYHTDFFMSTINYRFSDKKEGNRQGVSPSFHLEKKKAGQTVRPFEF